MYILSDWLILKDYQRVFLFHGKSIVALEWKRRNMSLRHTHTQREWSTSYKIWRQRVMLPKGPWNWDIIFEMSVKQSSSCLSCPHTRRNRKKTFSFWCQLVIRKATICMVFEAENKWEMTFMLLYENVKLCLCSFLGPQEKQGTYNIW